jgi:hypothetical protein
MIMETKTHTTKSGDTWEWVETPEFLEALAQYRQLCAENKARLEKL